eukprot:gene29779-5242_t
MSATEGAEATPPPADDVRYAVGEKVLVPHTDKFYEAKVLKTEISPTTSAEASVNEEEVAHGLRSYFDKSLEAVLLYRSERAHAAKALSGGLVASSVFGAEHLCRLFIKLPDLLIAASASEEQDVMLWMSDNIGTLFLPKEKYINAP